MKDYQIIQEIYESNNSLIYKAQKTSNDCPCILKVLKEGYPTPDELTRYKQEYEIARSIESDEVIKVYDLKRHENSLMMVLEDFGGQSLNLLLPNYQLTLEEFLKLSLKVTKGLDAIHAKGVIHKDINPSNIVYNPETCELKIIDFGIATHPSWESQTIFTPLQLEGTLAYIAPEQTGRMNRDIDYRSDYYSLGITFYELLTHRLPFESTDPMELVHCHIARQPVACSDLLPSIPLTVSKIVMKLLAKSPEERYQTTLGLQTDLENCLHQLQTFNQINTYFPLGQQDVSDKFHISNKLYGRERDVEQLLSVFDRICQGQSEMMMVSGYSGVGKSSLVNEIQKPIVSHRGYFIRGKFDQFRRDIPYSALSQAFQDLVSQLLTESDLQNWKKKLLDALGSNCQVIIDLIPELEQIVGKQPPASKLGATEAQNRFAFSFQKFIHVFARKEHPLVIFLDDLQWADLPSLELIELLMAVSDKQYLLIIGAYRDNEVSFGHPLIQTLEQLKKEIEIHQLLLRPLAFNDVSYLISDTLRCSIDKSKTLAELITRKTGGNPFFVTQLLQFLYKDRLIFFNKDSGGWQWDIDKIQEVGITENVVELMLHKIQELGESTREILNLAACLGNQFSLDLLSIANNKSQTTIAQLLQPAIKNGLIVPLSKNYNIPLLWNQQELNETTDDLSSFSPQLPKDIRYKFLHDRIQQAAYLLVSEQERKETHLQLGFLLLQSINESDLEENIFDIVSQLNQGMELIFDRSQRDKVAQLNLKAGMKAKTSAAYESALTYLETGLKMLATDCWDSDYQLALEIHIETLEALLINTQFERMEQLSEIVLQHTKDLLDEVKIHQIRIFSYYAQFQPKKAINIALKALSALGINISSGGKEDAIVARVQTQQDDLRRYLKGKTIKNLIDLPPMVDPYKLGAVTLLQQIISSAHTTDFTLYVEVVLTLLNLCIQCGNTPHALAAYALYGVLVSSLLGDYDFGYQLGELSIQLLEKFDNSKSEAIIIQMYYGLLWHWKSFLREENAQTQLLKGFQSGVDAGDYEFGSYAAFDYCLLRFLIGTKLEESKCDFENYGKIIQNLKQKFTFNSIEIFQGAIKNFLDDEGNNECVILGDSVSEENAVLRQWIQVDNHWLLFLAYFCKTLSCYFFKHYDSALHYAIEAESHFQAMAAFLTAPQYIFYYSLALFSCSPSDVEEEQLERLRKLELNQEKLESWSQHCPENFQNKYFLVEAERNRISGNLWRASELYDRAIKAAQRYEFLHEEAIAYERAAEFYLAVEREELGLLYLRNAHHCYSRWGAKAKVIALENEYPQYLINTTRRTESNQISPTRSTGGSSSEVLDLSTVVKASQVLSGEIILEKLLVKLMQIAIENAGAQKGFLLLPTQGTTEVLAIEAGGTVETETIQVLQSTPIDTLDPIANLPLLSSAIVNYVARTQESIVLNDAVNQGQFTRDPYITTVQPKSVLCSPLLNQGQLSGILYLENNLTTGAFTADRIEVLNILSSQAAISIENSRLYRTLEQKVEERTKELSQTLGILKATQAELMFENALLRSDDQAQAYGYQVGGSLPLDALTYVVRSADRYLYKALKQGNPCYILNARQMGKSSLMVRMMHHLQQEGHRCAVLDMTRIGSDEVTPAQWYKGLAVELWQALELTDSIRFSVWWQERQELSVVQRLGQFFEEVMRSHGEELEQHDRQLIIFLDEIDTVLSLNFPVNDFFALLRSLYNQRAVNPIYKRLTFALFGVAAPADLIADRKRTPFNIGQPIELSGFQPHEAQPLSQGLSEKVENPQTILNEVLYWTGGQPFLTQKLCQMIRETSDAIPINTEAEWVENLVRTHILDHWESQDEPQHLRTIRDRILESVRSSQLLALYQQILQQGEIETTGSEEERELLLSGIVVKQLGQVKVYNRIYQTVFDADWVAARQDRLEQQSNQ